MSKHKVTKTEARRLRALLDKVPAGPWYEVAGDVRTGPSPTAPEVVWTYLNEGGGAASLEVAEYIALANPDLVRRLLDMAGL